MCWNAASPAAGWGRGTTFTFATASLRLPGSGRANSSPPTSSTPSRAPAVPTPSDCSSTRRLVSVTSAGRCSRSSAVAATHPPARYMGRVTAANAHLPRNCVGIR